VGIDGGEGRRKGALRILLLAITVLVLWIVGVYVRIGLEAKGDPLQHADAIVVFGAAEYVGKPSPVFRSRLDHAFELWQQHYAPVIITTGGSAADPTFSEGGVGSRYLESRGVPETAIIAETQANDTSESAQRVSAIMHKNGMKQCIAVSDGYHLFRIKHMMEREGITVRGAARRELHTLPLLRRMETKLREALSYTAWLLHLT
jgi:uncharacterized SAM-binding protein YcdF (DUF218 family)